MPSATRRCADGALRATGGRFASLSFGFEREGLPFKASGSKGRKGNAKGKPPGAPAHERIFSRSGTDSSKDKPRSVEGIVWLEWVHGCQESWCTVHCIGKIRSPWVPIPMHPRRRLPPRRQNEGRATGARGIVALPPRTPLPTHPSCPEACARHPMWMDPFLHACIGRVVRAWVDKLPLGRTTQVEPWHAPNGWLSVLLHGRIPWTQDARTQANACKKEQIRAQTKDGSSLAPSYALPRDDGLRMHAFVLGSSRVATCLRRTVS